MSKKKEIIIIKKEDLRFKPRSGVIYTKIVPDKTKYSRKSKHKKKETKSE